MFETLLVAAAFVFAVACRTYAHPVVRKLGAAALVAATALAGYFLSGGSPLWALAGAAFWFLLPWLDLLLRIRPLRLPLDKRFRRRTAPPYDTFPHLRQITREVTDTGFEHVEDSGWEWEGMEQFVRTFYLEGDRAQASIHLKLQQHIAFAYLSISTRTGDGRVWTTWNYPFSYSLKFAPETQINRVRGAGSFEELLDQHRGFLESHGIGEDKTEPAQPDQLPALMEREMRTEVDHNLDRGLIKLSGNGTFRYSWRGLLYLWWQAVKDMVRLA